MITPKKAAAFLILAFLITTGLYSQIVDSIKTEEAGDFIKIRYQIRNSNPSQVYRVRVLCSINGGLNSEIRSLSGDVGENVSGGKSEYWAIWDVLKDVDELKSVDFIVRAELISDNSQNGKSTPKFSEMKIHALVFASPDKITDYALFGARLGYMGSWGVSARFAMRKTTSHQTSLFGSPISTTQQTSLINTSLDMTFRMVKKEKFQMHLMTGIAVCTILARQHDNGQATIGQYYDDYPGLDIGAMFDMGRLCYSFSGSIFKTPKSLKEGQYYLASTVNFEFGLGFKF
jgi:hypothetical protein